jgi:PadR family transcriptional regulator, regulatory protein PadR
MVRWSLTDKEAVILELLLEHGQLYGLELVERSSGALKRGTVYVTLARMEDKGLVVTRPPPRGESPPGLPRPRYRVTALGEQLLAVSKTLAARRPRGARA